MRAYRSSLRGRTYYHREAHEHIEANYRLEDRGYDTPCWIWTKICGGRDGDRPNVSLHGRGQMAAYRLSYETYVGPIPDDLTIDHLCGQPSCVNPAHLEPVTRLENMRRAGQVKLTESDVRAIRVLIAEGLSNTEIAAQYGVCSTNIGHIRCRRRWKHVP